MTSQARILMNDLARELNAADPGYETCSECRGSGDSDYGRCPSCDGYGSHPIYDEPEFGLPISTIQAGRNARPGNPYSASAMDRRRHGRIL